MVSQSALLILVTLYRKIDDASANSPAESASPINTAHPTSQNDTAKKGDGNV